MDYSTSTIAWNGLFLVINVVYIVQILYQQRPIKFDLPEQEIVYQRMFFPLIERSEFLFLMKLGSIDKFIEGECFAERGSYIKYLSILISGEVGVYNSVAGVGETKVDSVLPFAYIDSPQWIARNDDEEEQTFIVRLRCETPCSVFTMPVLKLG